MFGALAFFDDDVLLAYVVVFKVARSVGRLGSGGYVELVTW